MSYSLDSGLAEKIYFNLILREDCDTTARIASQFQNYDSVVYLADKGNLEYLDIKKYERLINQP